MKGSALGMLMLGFALAGALRGQAIDTILFRESSGTKRFTIIDQLADPQERRAFLKLYGAHEPHKRRKLAEEFVAKYPQSWLLAQAYEIGAKACIDLDDYAAALKLGAQSLRLFPENPLLLVSLANVQAQLNQPRVAEESARAALEYLDQFDRPAAIPAAKWPELQADLKASSYFVLGRVAAAEALHASGSEKHAKLLEAEESLMRARVLNASDAEAAYLLGLTELSLGRPARAAFYLADAQRTPGPLQARARESLRRIYESQIHLKGDSFDAYLNSVEKQEEVKAQVMSPPQSQRMSPGDYVGSQACQPCHAAIYDAWQKTGMGRMLRPYAPENVIGDFRANNQFSDETGAVVARMSIKRDKHYFAVRNASGDWRTYSVDYTIGSKWQQAYATRLASGDIHVFPVQYSAIKGQWINYWNVIDPPGSPRSVVTNFNELSPATSYQVNCAPCHTSQLRLTKTGSSAGHDYAFRESGINCEMCHGPAQNHVGAMKSGAASNSTAVPVHFNRIVAREYVAICGQCHAQTALHQAGPKGEMNYAAEGAAFFPVHLSQPYSDVSRRAFYKDGRFRETTFIVEAFRRSACFRKGQAHCGHCHQPHSTSAATNPTSLKFPDDPDRMCLQCHVKFTKNISAHTHHAASAEASRCVACHMPRIMNSVLFQARTHQIDDIPNAEMTERFGAGQSPNACLLCHSAKDARWVELKLQAW
jgi:predicted CXXCH cytochrome family protein